MPSRTEQLGGLLRHVWLFVGPRSLLLVAMMVVAAFSEGLGLLMLVPLLAFVGIGAGDSGGGSVNSAIVSATDRLGVSLSLEIVLLSFVAIITIRQLLVYSSARMAADARLDLEAKLRERYFDAVGRTSWRFLGGDKLDHVGHVLLIDCRRIGEAAINLLRIISTLLLLAANAIVAVMLAPVLAISILCAISILAIVFSNRLAAVRQQGNQLSRIQSQLYRQVENYMDNLRVAKMTGGIARMRQDFSATIRELSEESSAYSAHTESVKMSLQIVAGAAVAIALWMAVRFFGTGGPELLLLILITARLIPRVSLLNQQVHALHHDLPAFENAKSIVADAELHPDVDLPDVEPPIPERTIGLRDVCLFAADDPDKRLVADINLSINVNEVLAIHGTSGAGKSTIADVFSGLLQPDEGELLIDGIALDPAQTAAWRKSVSYVPQRAVLLAATVAQNLNWVLPRPTSTEELEAALACVDMLQVVGNLPEGINTRVDRREGTMSGGERQRLAIARELLRQPQLLILDEATNALDEATESRVLDNIRKRYPQMTILMISHRPSALARADRQVRVENGVVIATSKQKPVDAGDRQFENVIESG